MELFFGNNDLEDKLKNMFRLGVIHSINPIDGTARVIFPDDDDVVSFDLQVLHRNTYRNKDYNMPDIGEDVLCLFLPSGMAQGFILGSVYAYEGGVIPPEVTGEKRTVIFADGARFSYDRSTSQMDITIGPTSIMANTQSVVINTPVSVDVTSGKHITATAGESITATTPGTVTVSAAKGAQITAPLTTINGDVQVNGMVVTTGDVISDRISLQHHVHTGNQGAPTSEPIKPQ